MNQKGVAPILILVAVIGIVAFLAISSSAPFKNKLLTSLYPKEETRAAAGDLTGSTFFETFTGNPSAPQAFTSPRWDIQVHERGMVRRDPGVQNPMNAQHGMDCGAPPNAHPVSTSDHSVFNCRDHVMTSLNGNEYGVIYLTPDHMLDWSNGEAVLSFDISTEKMSGRDWPDIILSPWADQQALPLLSDLSQGVDLQGPSKNMIQFVFDTGEGAPHLAFVRNGVVQKLGGGLPALSSGITAGTNQAATRQPIRMTISSNRIRIERLASPTGQAIVWFDQAISPPLTFNQAVVQFGHHSYDPFKDGAGVAATWHWDNVSLSPAKPFTMLKVNQRYVYGGTSQTITFPPAPANAILRFSAYGRPVVNGVARNPVVFDNHPEHMSSYNVPIAQGSTSATIQLTKHDWYEHGYMAKDFAIWSPNAPGATPAPSVIPSPSPSTSPTPSPSQSPQSSPSPLISPTPSASAKPGDIDGNNRVDIFDYNILLTNFGRTGSGLQGDFDNNGRVDIFDFNQLLTNFGK